MLNDMHSVANQGVEMFALANGQQLLSNVDVALQMNSSGQYLKTPWRKPDEAGFRAQAGSVSHALGDFNDLEHLSPVLTSGITPRSHYGEDYCEDISQVWTFRHSPSTIRPAAKALLGNPI